MATAVITDRVTEYKELSERREDSFLVQLLWYPFFNEIWLSVKDESGEFADVLLRVPNEKANHAFWHPNAYRPA